MQETNQEAVPPETRKPERGRGSGKGSNNKGRKWGKPGPGRPRDKPVEPFEMPDFGHPPEQLDWMAWALGNDEKMKEPPELRHMRDWLWNDPRGFILAKMKLEAESKQPVVEQSTAEVEGEDKGSEGCEEMYERLLGEWGEELR